MSSSSAAMAPLLSILIPTHNRARYAVPTVRAIVESLSRAEVVLCDTSPVDEVSAPLSDLTSAGKVKVIRPGEGLSVVENFNRAVDAAEGNFCIFIGDDDFVHASAQDVAEWAAASGIDTVRCTFPASYYWPDFESRFFGDGYAGRIAISGFSGKVRPIDPQRAYAEALKNLGAGVLTMPRAYLGMVSSRLIHAIRRKHGQLFGGVSPDIYSAALIANTAESSCELDFPFIVPGSSGVSTSGKSAIGKHHGELRDNDHIRPFKNLQWDPRIPEFYSVPTVWSYSLIKAAEVIGNDDTADFARLYIKCLLKHPEYWRYTQASLANEVQRHGLGGTFWRLGTAFLDELIEQGHRVGRRLLSPKATGGAHAIAGLSDCSAASVALTRYLENIGQPHPNLPRRP